MSMRIGRINPRPALNQLTSLRFFAALAIVFCHFGGLTFSEPRILQVLPILSSGVGFFFVLSGFVLVYAYASDQGVRSLRAFYQARFARLYPIYTVGLFLALVFVLRQSRFGGTDWESDIIAPTFFSLFLLQAWIPQMSNLLNGPGWSLSAEAFFYLMFPILLSGRIRKLLESKNTIFLLILWISGTIPYFVLYKFFPNAALASRHSLAYNMANWAAFWPLVRFPEFVIGVLIGLEYLKPDRIEFPIWIVVSAFLAVAIILIACPIDKQIFLHNSLFSPAFATIIYGLAISKGRLVNCLSNKYLVLLGESSYALYILHFPLRYLLGSAWGRSVHCPPGSLFFWLYLAGSILISVLVFRYIETPMRIWIRSLGWGRFKRH